MSYGIWDPLPGKTGSRHMTEKGRHSTTQINPTYTNREIFGVHNDRKTSICLYGQG